MQAGDSLLYQGHYSLSPAAAAGRPEPRNESGSSGFAGDMVAGDASPDMQWDLVSLRVLVANEQAANSAGATMWLCWGGSLEHAVLPSAA